MVACALKVIQLFIAVQAEALNKHLANLPDRLEVDLVVSSPLTRTLETATGVFASEEWTDESQGVPLMREQPAKQVCGACKAGTS